MRVAGLNIYPVKSGRAVAVEAAELETRGFAGDRRWMIVDWRGRFVSQRERPALARIIAELTPAGLRLVVDGDRIEIARPQPGTARIPVSVWQDAFELPEAVEARPFLERHFGVPLRLVYQPDDAARSVDRDWARAGDTVSLADGFPLLVTTVASLEALAAALGAELPMERFRPSLVIAGAGAWEEDRWARLKVGAAEIELVKPCARCVTTTVDQELGVVTGDEPLSTLRRLRFSADRRNPGMLFGWNAVPRHFGIVRLGDPVEVLERRAPWPIRPEGERRPAGMRLSLFGA